MFQSLDRMTDFDFNSHRSYQKNYKTFLRFTVYGIVVVVLLYLVVNQSRGVDRSVQDENLIETIEIELADSLH